MSKTNSPCTVLFSGSYEINMSVKYTIEFLCQAMIPHMTHKQHISDSKTANMFCKDSTFKNRMSGNTDCNYTERTQR